MRSSQGSLPSHDRPSGVVPEAWSLQVDGAVEQVLEFDTTDLSKLELRTVSDDFFCIEGWTAEGLEWRGVPVETLINRAQPITGVAYGLVHGMDEDYACGFTLERLSHGLLALELDGEPLPVEHGGPTRLVLPDEESDCYESVKWVTQIEILDQPPTERDTAADTALARID